MACNPQLTWRLYWRSYTTDNCVVTPTRNDEGMPSPPRTAVLIVRAWTEGGPVPHLRARITQNLDVASADDVVTTATTVEEVCQTVRAWLEALLSPEE